MRNYRLSVTLTHTIQTRTDGKVEEKEKGGNTGPSTVTVPSFVR